MGKNNNKSTLSPYYSTAIFYCASLSDLITNQLINMIYFIDDLCAGESDACNPFFEEVLCYLRVGRCDMPRPEVKDVVVVIGKSGAGKSTFVQFFANSTNTLKSYCLFGQCWVDDDSSNIGGGIISKTFLPNMVVHDDATPFFDMPGFDDSRNESIEIANSFFVQEAIKPSEKVKIIILTLDRYFESSNRVDFLDLLKYTSVFVKEPLKFTGSISLIVNRVPYADTYEDVLGRAVFYIQNVMTDFDDVAFDDELRPNALNIMNELVKTETVGGYDPINIGIFRSPTSSMGNATLLKEDPVFQENMAHLNNLISGVSVFKPTIDGDFGLPVSSEAKLLLDHIATQVSADIVNEIVLFANAVLTHVIETFTAVSQNRPVDLPELEIMVRGILTADYSFADTPDESASFYINETIEAINSFGNGFVTDTQKNLLDFSSFLQFVEDLKGPINIQPKLWVLPLQGLVANITTALNDTVSSELIDIVFLSARGQAESTATKIMDDLKSLDTIEAKVDRSVIIDRDITACTDGLEPLLRTSTFTATFDYLSRKYSALFTTGCSDCVSIDGVKAVEILLLLNDFQWRSLDWMGNHRSMLVVPVVRGTTINYFLSNLYKDLVKEKVQSERAESLHYWWSIGKDLNNYQIFMEFFVKATSLDFLSTNPYQQNSTILHTMLINDQGALARMHSLLRFTLGNHAVSSSADFDVIISGNFLSLSNIYDLTRDESSVAIIAMDKFYLDRVLDRKGSDVAIIAPQIWVKQEASIILNGQDGDSILDNHGRGGVPSRQGFAGKNAGTLYMVHQNITGEIRLQAQGGKGGKGGPGANGVASPDSTAKSFSVDSDDCAAWSGGRIRIRVYPNTCNSGECCDCHAGDDGVQVVIDGHPGVQGGRGQDGGKGGVSGLAGAGLIIKVDNIGTDTILGNIGNGGDGGAGGSGGRGGKFGNNLRVTVDDVTGGAGKKCAEYSRSYEIVERWGPNGLNGNTGLTGDRSGRKEINLDKYRGCIGSFLSSIEPLKQNEFTKEKTVEFLTHFNNHASIPKSA